jgi:type IV pilus assembly protein PilX
MKRVGKFSRKHQRGMTLIISLIFLVLLTILGLSVTNTNSVQTRMAANTRQRDLAFQAAEHAMKAVETGFDDPLNAANLYIQNVILLDPAAATVAKPSYVLLNGETHANDAYYWKETFDWTTTQSTPVTGISSDLAVSQPRYTIEQMPKSTCPEDATKTCFYYRVTARGVGSNAAATSVVQTMLKFKK